MALIKLYIVVDDLEAQLSRYTHIRVYRSIAGISGTYSEITTAATRPKLEPGVGAYIYYDESGLGTYWYRVDYFNAATSAASSQSDPRLGDDAVSLEGIMTVQNLKDVYLTGVDLTDDSGTPFPEVMHEFGIRSAIAWIENELFIEVRPTDHVDRYDYDRAMMQAFGFIQLDHYPAISVSSVKLYWPSSTDPYTFPSDWIQLDQNGGQINLVPRAGSIAQALVVGGSYLPTMLTQFDYIPRAIEVTYQSGFAIGALPYDIRYIIGMYASLPTFNTAGDLIAGAGIANYSLSVDGLSQSVGTTSSATNSGYGSRILQYQKQIKEALPQLRRKYRNVGLAVV